VSGKQSPRQPAATPVARRKAARRKPAARRRPRPPGLPSKQNQLSLLDQNIAELSGDLQALKTPADKAHDAIENVKAPLLVPGKIKAKVERVKTIAKGLDSLARLVSIVPGPIGVGAKGLHRALVPLLGERGVPGILDQVLAALTRVDKALKPVVTKLNQVERPIDAARNDLANLLVHVGRLVAIAESVRSHYGETPPDDVQACLGKLNEGLAPVVTPMRAARKAAAAQLAELAKALDQLTAALKPLNDVARDVERALSQLESKAVRDISNALNKIAQAVKPILDAWDWIIEQTIGRLLKLFRIDLGAIDRFFRNLVNALNPFKGLQRRIDQVTQDLAARVAALPAVAALVRALDTLTDLERAFGRAIENVLRGACRTLLLPQDASLRAGAKRRVASGKRARITT
jgi:prefoldin subunit 5